MDSKFIATTLSFKWKLIGDLEIIPFLEGFHIFWFTNEDDWWRVQAFGGQWGGSCPRRVETEHQVLERDCDKGYSVAEITGDPS